MSRGTTHRYLSYACAEQGKHREAEYHRLEAKYEETLDKALHTSVFSPLYFWRWFGVWHLEAQVMKAWRATQ